MKIKDFASWVLLFAAGASATGGGAWVADTWGSRMVKLGPTGQEVRVVGPYIYPYAVGIDPSDGAVWFTVNGSEVVKMTDLGQELFRRTYSTEDISVNGVDGACWVHIFNPPGVARLDRNGNETANRSFSAVGSVSSAAGDGTAWVTGGSSGVVFRVNTAGSVLASFGGFGSPGRCAAHAGDNSLSLIESGYITRVTTTGSVVFRTSLANAGCIAVNSADDATWVGAGSFLYKLNAAGSILFSVDAGGMVNALGVNSADGSAWAAIYDLNAVAKYTATGSRVFLKGGFNKVKGLAAEQIPAYESVSPASMGKIRAIMK